MEAFKPGMYVRLPVPEAEDDGEREADFRSFRLAQVDSVDTTTGVLVATMRRHPLGMSFAQETLSSRVENVARCHIYPGSHCFHRVTGRQGTILARTTENFTLEEPQMYYAALGGDIVTVPETDLIVSGDAQDPNPRDQMMNYELHEPGWRSLRNQVVETMAELRNATYGLEELVGSRVLLLPHQAEVVTRALGDHTCRFVLADEVGLGKTIEAAIILKGLRRRNPELRTLIVTPSSLTHQWMNELSSRFWMRLDIVSHSNAHLETTEEGIIVSAEELATHSGVYEAVARGTWDCVIVDEAHHVRKQPQLQNRLMQLSRNAASVLVLSATPIERRSAEYLDLLRLMDPKRYCELRPEAFQELLDAQAALRSSIEYIRSTLTPDLYDADEFMEEFDTLIEVLPGDLHLSKLHAAARASGTMELEGALGVVAHINTNYRVENRVLRNRRAHLDASLPTRTLDTAWAYYPDSVEREALDEVLDYCEFVTAARKDPVTLEYVRLLLHAAASSPYALNRLLEIRTSSVSETGLPIDVLFDDLLSIRNPREEPERIAAVVQTAPLQPDELVRIERLSWSTLRWQESSESHLANATLRSIGGPGSDHERLSSVLRAIHQITQRHSDGKSGKVLVFSSWGETLDALALHLQRIYGRRVFSQFRAGMSNADLESAADTFQADPSCQILLTDELGGEGRNFQIADGVIHVDLPWSPARIEQRIGRVDRLGRSGDVVSIVPFARETVEQDLFQIWNDVFHLFTRSMSGLEIALEKVQSELTFSLQESVRHGLEHLLPGLLQRVEEIRDHVERERYFEEGAINQRKRVEFSNLRDKYRDGKLLERTALPWAARAGLGPDFNQSSGITTFSPKHFNIKSMQNANILTLPDMDEAIRRAGRRFSQSIRGTFSRDLAILREDLVFYAPGDDPWFEWIIMNAERSDRGRCCAIFRPSNKVTKRWKGLELLYRIEIDPCWLYEAGFDPVQLFRAQGFLNYPTHRILISEEGEVLSTTSEFARAIGEQFDKSRNKDVHLGERSGESSRLSQFRKAYPPDLWHELTRNLFEIGDRSIREEFSFLGELGEEAREELEATLRNADAVRTWQQDHLGMSNGSFDLEREQRIIESLVSGISHPSIRLESACYWWLYPVKD